MKSLLLGLAAPLLTLAVWGIVGLPYDRWANGAAPMILMSIFLMPLACAAATAQLTALLSPRRPFDRRMQGGAVRRFVSGLCAGLLCVAMIGVLLIFADRFAPDWVLLCAAGLIAGIAAVLPLSRVRPETCFHCGYDLTAQPSPGQPGFGRCPECGAETIERMRWPAPCTVRTPTRVDATSPEPA